MIQSLPSCPGAYAVEFTLAHSQTLMVGKLGIVHLPAGEYVYLGSARGPGGIKARLGRHLTRPPTRIYWHIDYLLVITRAHAFCYVIQSENEYRAFVNPTECIWSEVLHAHPDSFIPAPGFGSGDCHSGCSSHLVAFQQKRISTQSILSSVPIGRILAESIEKSQDALCFGVLT